MPLCAQFLSEYDVCKVDGSALSTAIADASSSAAVTAETTGGTATAEQRSVANAVARPVAEVLIFAFAVVADGE